MLDRIESLENELRDVEIRLGDPAVQSDSRQLADLGRRFKQLEAVVAVAERLRSASDDIVEFREMLSATEGDEREEMRAEIERLEAQVVTDEEQLRVLLLPPDPNDGRNVILEIRVRPVARRPTSSPRISSTCSSRSRSVRAGAWRSCRRRTAISAASVR